MLKRLQEKLLPGDKTARVGIIWNLASLFVIGVSGIILNITIALFYDSSVLGVFNQVMAYYIVAGQIGALGLQNAAVYYTPRQANNESTGHLLGSFLLLTIITSGCAAAILFLLATPLGDYVYRSDAVKAGLQSAAFATILFPLNKVLLGFINGLRYMRAFAVIQGLRYIIIVLFIFTAILLGADGRVIPYSLLFSEALLFFIAAIVLFKNVRPRRPKSHMVKEGAVFGSKSVVGGIVGELNTKADIMVIGIFFSDSVVGIYSFASLLAEGFASLVVVFRNNMNPMFARLHYNEDKPGFNNLINQVRRRVLPFCAAGGASILGLFWLLCLLMFDASYKEVIFPLGIILFCISVASPAMVKGNVLTHIGRPELDTIITSVVLLFNVVLNFITVPLWGILGAAVATGASYIFLSILTNAVIRKQKL